MPTQLSPTVWGQHQLTWGQQTYVMGIVNITPDSFAGDGLAREGLSEEDLVQRAIVQAQRFVAEGATLLDVGGESTRPGAAAVTVAQEIARVVPVIEALHEVLPPDIMISIDTYKAEVARRALSVGACIINDIWGLRYDPAMAMVASEHGVPVV